MTSNNQKREGTTIAIKHALRDTFHSDTVVRVIYKAPAEATVPVYAV